MKKTPPNPESPEEILSLESATPEDDALWDLLGEASSPEASPLFSRNVMREVRLQKQGSPSFWQLLTRPQAIGGAALAVVLAIFTIILMTPPSSAPEAVADSDSAVELEVSEDSLDSYLTEELLLVAADEPALFSDEAVIAMLF